MSEKFLKVGVNGEYAEALGYLTSEFINSSAGVADANKPIVLDAAGLLPQNMVNVGAIDHGSIGGLGDDDHTIYSLADGSRSYSGIVQYASHPTFTADTDIIDKKYVDDLALGYDWLQSVKDTLATPPVSPTIGDRYIVAATATGAWLGHEDDIAQWNGASWDFYTPVSGNMVVDESVTGSQFLFDGASWVEQAFESTTAGDGLQISGNEVSIDPTLAGLGLGYATGVMNVNVDDSSIEITTDSLNVKALGITDAMLAGSISDGKLAQDYIQTSEVTDGIEWNGTALQIAADGVKDSHIDWGTAADQVSAGDVPIADAGNHTAENDVEGALQELYGLISERGVELTSGGVSKGDLLYVSAANTLSTYATITNFHKAVGLAHETVAALSPVKSLSNDTVLAGILSGATPGDVYYWDGTSHINSIPVTSGAYVIQTGVAINANDLYVEVRPVKKNI